MLLGNAFVGSSCPNALKRRICGKSFTESVEAIGVILGERGASGWNAMALTGARGGGPAAIPVAATTAVAPMMGGTTTVGSIAVAPVVVVALVAIAWHANMARSYAAMAS